MDFSSVLSSFSSSANKYLYSFFAAVIVYLLVRITQKSNRFVDLLPGPDNKSWLFGNARELYLSKVHGSNEFRWLEQFGGLYKMKGCFGEDRIVVSDPAALKTIMADMRTFSRTPYQLQLIASVDGNRSLFYVSGQDHHRIRNAMNPGFAASYIRNLIPIFQNHASKLMDRWETMKGGVGNQVLDVYKSIQDFSLDAIGEAAIGYDFQAQAGGDNVLADSFRHITYLASSRSAAALLADSFLPKLPSSIISFVFSLPSPAFKALARHRDLVSKLWSELLAESTKVNTLGGGHGSKNVLDLLINSNNTKTDSSDKLNDTEISHQISTVIVAGQDNTGNALAWAFHEMAGHPEWQELMRTEVQDMYERTGGQPSQVDFDKLKYLNAHLKETVRLYPGLPLSERIAETDTVLPLAYPVRLKNGEVVKEVPIKKGQSFVIGIASYNRMSNIWGSDPHKFRPERWFEDGSNRPTLGPYGNMMTFFSGPRTCIGWRFVVCQLQVALAESLLKFRFSLPSAQKHVSEKQKKDSEVSPLVAVTLIPVADDGTPHLPLCLETLDV